VGYRLLVILHLPAGAMLIVGVGIRTGGLW
jgi:hypothetical protein